MQKAAFSRAERVVQVCLKQGMGELETGNVKSVDLCFTSLLHETMACSQLLRQRPYDLPLGNALQLSDNLSRERFS